LKTVAIWRLWTGIFAGCALALFAFSFVLAPLAGAQTSVAVSKRSLIVSAISDANVVRLFGNTRPEANDANDRGKVADSLPMQHLTLQLRRSPEQEQALTRFIDQLHDPASANYHRWLTPEQFGAQYGPVASDIQKVTSWLQSHGFTVDTVYPSGMAIGFSGNAGQVSAAFHTEIHHIEARGAAHIANMSDPQIPAALAPAVVGIVALHDIPHRPNIAHKRVKSAEFTVGGGEFLVTPADLATIYNFNPAFNAGVTGQGQTIYLIEDSDLYSTSDWTTFRSVLGLSSFSGASLTTVHPAPPTGPTNCNAPGVNGDGGEAILDAEWSSAAAPSAAIVMATCANNPDGLLTAVTNLLNGPSPPAIISISYGECEAFNGAASNAAYNAIYQQGVAEGASIFVSTGDQDAGVCDFNASVATHGIGVNALASTPYNVAVGGTDFSDTYSGVNNTYWNSGNTASFGSAKSYIPEIPWNGSCGSQLLATHYGFATTYGASGFCNNSPGTTTYRNNTGGSGGPSACATGNPAISGVVGGTCQGYAKPSWQSGVFGIPSDGVRDLPDVSLFASNGYWNHYYVFCYSDPNNGGTPCTGSPNNWSGAGGTSFSSPILAGVQALINQNMGAPQGNPNAVYYKLAATEYGASGSSSCNSSNGNAVGSSCIFYDVTLGDMDAPCTGTHNCYLPSGTTGVLSTDNNSYAPAFKTGTGWDFATGIGTINVFNLVNGWKAFFNNNPTTLQVNPANDIAASGNQGGSFSPNSFQYVLTTVTGTVNYTITGVPNWLTASSTSGTATTAGTTITFSVNSNANALSPATYTATIAFNDTTNNVIARATPASLIVLNAASANGVLQVSPATNIATSGNTGGPFSPASFPYQLSASKGSVSYSVTGLPGWLTVSSDSGAVTTSPTSVTFTVNSNANSLSAGSYSGTIVFNDVSNGAPIETISATITVNNGAPGLGSPTVTYVSGKGTDTGVCPVIEPCATFAYALSVAPAGGVINCVDAGSFGAVTITKAITIDCGGGEGGQVGSILASGTNGIIINAAVTDHVIIRNIDINGASQASGPGLIGINVTAVGSLTLENVNIMSFNNVGINFQPAVHADLFVFKSVLQNCAGGGIVSSTSSGTNRVNFSDSQIKISGVGFTAGANTNAVIFHSTVSNNIGGSVLANVSTAQVSIDRSTISNSQVFGIHATNSAIVRLSNTSVAFNNGTGLLADGGGQILSWQNNWVAGNFNDGARTGTIAPQ
jgi:hypothetical protein